MNGSTATAAKSLKGGPANPMAFDELPVHVRRLLGEMWSNLDLSFAEVKVFFVLVGHINHKSKLTWPSREKIMQITGLGRTAVYDALKSLQRKGLIETVPGKAYRRFRIVAEIDNHRIRPGNRTRLLGETAATPGSSQAAPAARSSRSVETLEGKTDHEEQASTTAECSSAPPDEGSAKVDQVSAQPDEDSTTAEGDSAPADGTVHSSGLEREQEESLEEKGEKPKEKTQSRINDRTEQPGEAPSTTDRLPRIRREPDQGERLLAIVLRESGWRDRLSEKSRLFLDRLDDCEKDLLGYYLAQVASQEASRPVGPDPLIEKWAQSTDGFPSLLLQWLCHSMDEVTSSRVGWARQAWDEHGGDKRKVIQVLRESRLSDSETIDTWVKRNTRSRYQVHTPRSRR